MTNEDEEFAHEAVCKHHVTEGIRNRVNSFGCRLESKKGRQQLLSSCLIHGDKDDDSKL